VCVLENKGTIQEVKDGIVIVKEGLKKVTMGELVEFEKSKLKGIVNYLGAEKYITVLGNIKNLTVGDTVKRLRNLPQISVSREIMGRVLDALGNPIDGLGKFTEKHYNNKILIEKKSTRYNREGSSKNIIRDWCKIFR